MIITKIKRLHGRRQRYSVHLDGVPALELSDWTIGKCGLRTGDDLDESTVDKIKSTEAETQAKNTAINYLSYRQRSSKEIVDHLVKKGFTRDCAEDVAHQLQSAQMVNDLEFARAYVRDRLKRKPIGQALLRTQLLTKGITSPMTDMVLGELISLQSQQASALQAAKRKLQVTKYSKRNLDEEKRKKRLLDFLLRRGFSYEIAMKTIRTTLDR
ncbi:MAG: RecX family transcriptional regulator [Bacteroidota bacterium]